VERRLVRGFCDELERLAIGSGARDVHEVGCGEGELLLRLARRGLSARGSDVSESVIEEARGRAAAAQLDVSFRATPIVLEHLDDPEAALQVVAALARPWAIVSVPREPLWRLLNLGRLKYVRDLGNTPGHLQHWSRRSFLGFLERRLEVVAVRTPVPWTMALCRSA
jgi:SAM-dependent methyltransferase